jgi:hypothetical protein
MKSMFNKMSHSKRMIKKMTAAKVVVMKKSGRMERADERRIETHEKESEL